MLVGTVRHVQMKLVSRDNWSAKVRKILILSIPCTKNT